MKNNTYQNSGVNRGQNIKEKEWVYTWGFAHNIIIFFFLGFSNFSEFLSFFFFFTPLLEYTCFTMLC